MDCLDRAPYINNLIPSFEEVFGFIWEMVGNAAAACGVRLIDVDTLDRAA